jgi:hypothetical protein
MSSLIGAPAVLTVSDVFAVFDRFTGASSAVSASARCVPRRPSNAP